MKEIKLTQGKVTFVDDEDFDKVHRLKPYACRFKNNYYAYYLIKIDNTWKTLPLHRFIIGVKNSLQVDHIDGNGLNNQKSNLRICTRSQNRMNQGRQKRNTSGYKGVTWNKKANKWHTSISCDNKIIYLGLFDTKEEAYKTYCEACIKYHGEFAHF